jgi:hypothetical protein
MFGVKIFRASNVLGAAQGYKPLYVRKTPVVDPTTKNATFLQESAWVPTPLELDRIIKGASIYVGLLTTVHPPIKVTVGPTPDEALET